MKSKMLAVLFLLSFNSFALEIKQNPEHINMAISVTDKMLEMQMEAPMKTVLGFTQKPQTSQQMNKWKNLQTLWFKQMKELIIMQNNHCMEEETSLEYELEEDLNYGEVLGKVVFKCQKALNGEGITIKLKEHFKKAQAIDLTLFIGNQAPKTFKLMKSSEKITI